MILKGRFYLLLLILNLFNSTTYSQKVWFLKLDITVTSRDIKLPGATITITKDGSNFEKLVIGKESKYIFELPQDAEYYITVSKEGYVSKILSVSTNNVPEKQVTDYYFVFKVKVDIFKVIEGIDYSVLDEPIGKIFYDRNPRVFDYDLKYTRFIQAQLNKLKKELLEKEKLEEEKIKQEKEEIISKEKAIQQQQGILQALEIQKKTEIHHILSDAGCRGLGDRMWYYLSRNLDFQSLKNLVRGSKKEKKILGNAIQTLMDLSVNDDYKLPALAACCLIISCRSDKRKIICKKSDIDGVPNHRLSITSWLAEQGKRTGRIFDVEPVGILGLRKQSSMQEIRDIYPALKEGTPFWKRITGAYDLADDSSRESFYDTWFPNDIPDEWSAADQQKSHGRGCKKVDVAPAKAVACTTTS
jgi:hypothetical protein